MFRRDYIIRLIEEFGVLWARLVEALRGGDISAARLTIDAAYQRLLGLTPHDIQALSSAHLIARLQLGVTPEAGREQLWVMSALLRAEGDLAAAAGLVDVTRQYYRRALDLILAAEQLDPDPTLPSYVPTRDELMAILQHGAK